METSSFNGFKRFNCFKRAWVQELQWVLFASMASSFNEFKRFNGSFNGFKSFNGFNGFKSFNGFKLQCKLQESFNGSFKRASMEASKASQQALRFEFGI